MGREHYVLAKARNFDRENDDKLDFETVAGPSTPVMSQAATQFHQTKKGRELFQKLKDAEAKVEIALKASDKAENALRKVQAEAAADVFFKERHKSEIDAAAEKAFDAKAAYESAQWDQRRIWYLIEIVLQSWGKVKILPRLIHDAKKELAIVEDRLKAAHENRDYALCGELTEKINDLKFGIECWTNSFRETTGEDPSESKELKGENSK